jgi:hypothetical protein
MNTPAFHKPRKGGCEDEEEGPQDLGTKARAFARLIAAAEKRLQIKLLPPSKSHKVRALASFGIPPVSGVAHRAIFVAGDITNFVLTQVMEQVDQVAAHRTNNKGGGGQRKKKPVGAWGSQLWVNYEDLEVTRGDVMMLPHDGCC